MITRPALGTTGTPAVRAARPTPHRFTVHYWGGSPGYPGVTPAAKAAMAGWCAPAPVYLRSAVWPPRPVYRGQGPSGAGVPSAQGGYLRTLPVVLSNPYLHWDSHGGAKSGKLSNYLVP